MDGLRSQGELAQALPARPLTVSRGALLVGGDDSRFRHLVHDLLAFSVRLEAVRAKFGAHIGLTGLQYTILISVRHLQGADGVGVKALAEHIGLSGAFVTIETGKLIRMGLLRKRANPDDRRRVLLSVTGEGEARLARLAPVQREINDAIFEPLDAARFAALCDIAAALRRSSDRSLALSAYLLGTGEEAK
ncbi:MAG: winged helix-turn-helix transcriptional regulator [Rhodobiaceae bacterium]|nr:winged helix-turn-helix transcriptional regulator [Rhodobiaceae bacterium]